MFALRALLIFKIVQIIPEYLLLSVLLLMLKESFQAAAERRTGASEMLHQAALCLHSRPWRDQTHPTGVTCTSRQQNSH